MGPDGASCYQPLPERVPGIKRASKVSAGEDHTLVLTAVTLPPLPLSDLHFGLNDSLSQEVEEPIDADEPLPEFLTDVDFGSLEFQAGKRKARNRKNSSRKNSIDGEQLVEADASANESTTEYAKLSSDDTILSKSDERLIPRLVTLSELCQREVAKTVTIRNAIPTLLFAELYSAPLLASYALRFMEE